jgi:adenylate kinase family enzyme
MGHRSAMETKQLILLGPPGVEIKAQAAGLAERWQVPYVALGNLLNGAIDQGSTLGVEARPYVEAGELVPDELAVKLLRRRFEQPDTMLKGWVLAGFPRTLPQAQAFDQWWAAVGQPVATVAYLKAMTGLLINRLSTQQNSAAPIASIRERLARHEAEVAPLLEYYQQPGAEGASGGRPRLITVNASLSFAEVARELAQLGQDTSGTAPGAPLIDDEAELNALLIREPHLVVDCMASWCGSCKRVAPLIDRLAEAYSAVGENSAANAVAVVKIDFDANRGITKRFGLKGIPAVMFFRQGELVETLTGVKAYSEYSAAVTRLLSLP